jgi:hypothetical protein
VDSTTKRVHCPKEIEPKYSKDKGGKRWGIALVLFMWKRCHKMWKGRNKRIHKPKNNRVNIEVSVKKRYEQQGQWRMASDQRQIFRHDLETMLMLPTSELKA